MAGRDTYDYRGQEPIGYNPGQYPIAVGDAYIGEIRGFIYDPYQNKYVPNPQEQSSYYQNSGLQDKDKGPSMTDTILPIGAAAGAFGLAQGFASDPTKFVSGIYNGVGSGVKEVGGLMGLGQQGSAQAASATPSVAGSSLGTGAAGATAPGAAPGVPSVMGAGLTESVPGSAGAAYSAGNTFGVLGSTGPVLGLAGQAALYGQQLYDTYDKLGDARTSGAGAVKGALLSTGPFLGWAAPAVDFLGIKTGKHKDQYARDAGRDFLQETGLIDENFQLENADGSKFDIGRDGGALLEGGHLNGQRHVYDIDGSDPQALAIIPGAKALATLMVGNDKKLVDDFTGYLVNAARSSGDSVANINHYFQKVGLDHDKAYGMIHQMNQDGKLDKETADQLKNGLDEWFKVGAYANPNQAPSIPNVAFGGGQNKPPQPTGTMGLTTSSNGGRPVPQPQVNQQSLQRPSGTMGLGGRQRISPGVWQDEKGTYNSKTGVRGK